jgi:hypothetical protein
MLCKVVRCQDRGIDIVKQRVSLTAVLVLAGLGVSACSTTFADLTPAEEAVMGPATRALDACGDRFVTENQGTQLSPLDVGKKYEVVCAAERENYRNTAHQIYIVERHGLEGLVDKAIANQIGSRTARVIRQLKR